MNERLYVIYDSKAEIYSPPLLYKTRGEAIRDVSEKMCDPNSSLGKYPEDYSLFELGYFNSFTGLIELLSAPVCLGLLLEFKKETLS